MAQAVGSPAPVQGHDDTFGGHFFGPVDYSGPSSYAQGGDALDPKPFGCPNSLLGVIPSADQQGVWFVMAVPLYSGASVAFQLLWISLTTGVVGGQPQTAGQQAAAGTNLSGYTVRLVGIGF